jgi:hypothetical protein
VQLVFSGHNHVYERFFGSGIQFVVAGGGGAPSYGIDDNPEADNTAAVRRAADVGYTFVSATQTGHRMRLEAVAVPDATPVDCFVVDLDAPGVDLGCSP